ncbi:MAG: hypothetical protein ABI967_04420 [bacterium]
MTENLASSREVLDATRVAVPVRSVTPRSSGWADTSALTLA